MSKTIVKFKNDRLLDSNYIVDDSTILSKKINGVVLYENASGSNEAITLSESVTDGTYSLLRIDYRTSDNYPYTAFVPLSTSSFNTSLIGSLTQDSGQTYLKIRDLNINGTTIQTRSARYVEITLNETAKIASNNYIYITKVTAYI